ncbi:expressed protein [Cryptococcus deneoformans JEC21]|uniref:Expressed protein n=1 Tax=Cryptococcus deneoformans (strain JEC21 / ATCC MYA-565) TaxID=214684 RepID=Q5KIK4_CRYD1|nr:expressed protein [Cryptococcus neoformans var. neoformans JEC21]AAW43358.1 expressed protein [Cryptococcus neoformans var. neoformans JEC21]
MLEDDKRSRRRAQFARFFKDCQQNSKYSTFTRAPEKREHGTTVRASVPLPLYQLTVALYDFGHQRNVCSVYEICDNFDISSEEGSHIAGCP